MEQVAGVDLQNHITSLTIALTAATISNANATTSCG
jgi:hypothetical protein